MSGLISEDWLKATGFKWHEMDRQPSKHWVLWLGGCMDCPPPGSDKHQYWRFSGAEDFGLELAFNANAEEQYWFCWFRGDSAGRYHRFIHVRAIRYQHEIINLVCALTGRSWRPEDHLYGSAMCERCADRTRVQESRLDIRMRDERPKWSEAEKDDTRGRALPEHLDEAMKAGKAK